MVDWFYLFCNIIDEQWWKKRETGDQNADARAHARFSKVATITKILKIKGQYHLTYNYIEKNERKLYRIWISWRGQCRAFSSWWQWKCDKFVTQCLKNGASRYCWKSFNVIRRSIETNVCVFIRKKINSYWKQMNETEIKWGSSVNQLNRIPRKRRSVAGLRGSWKFQVSNGGKCNDILQHTITASQSQNAMDREMSMLLFYFLASEVEDSLSEHINQLRDLFVRLMKDNESAVRIMALKATAQVLEHVSATSMVSHSQVWYRRCWNP